MKWPELEVVSLEMSLSKEGRSWDEVSRKYQREEIPQELQGYVDRAAKEALETGENSRRFYIGALKIDVYVSSPQIREAVEKERERRSREPFKFSGALY